jgi:hypothetical protein
MDDELHGREREGGAPLRCRHLAGLRQEKADDHQGERARSAAEQVEKGVRGRVKPELRRPIGDTERWRDQDRIARERAEDLRGQPQRALFALIADANSTHIVMMEAMVTGTRLSLPNTISSTGNPM